MVLFLKVSGSLHGLTNTKSKELCSTKESKGEIKNMFCQKCGKEIADDAGFCKFCGEKVVKDEIQEQGSQGTKSEKKISGKIVLGIVAGVIVLTVAAAVSIMFFHSRDRENMNDENLAETEQAGPNLQLYDVTQDSIDVYAQNRQPNARDFSLTWDKTLFYLLEDVTPEDTDGQIEKYDIARKELTNAQNGNQISYEIYTNPETGKMNKIVSIEDQGNTLEITDYYYQDNGQPNFIYQRTDSIYTPTYATPDKTGQRFYFNNDTLVRWRWINAPLQVEEIALTEDAQSSAQTQHIFNDLDAGKQDEYNQKETQMLNAAYNTYEAMEKSSDHANVKGYVLDTIGNPVKDAAVEFYAGEDAIGSVVTDENGYYETGISLYNAGYDLTISCKGYADATIYGAVADKANVTNWMENVYLTPKVKQECSVQLNIYDADTTTQNEDETVSKTGIANASVVVRSGVNNTSGKSVAKADSDSNGMVTLNLNVGVYTIEISVNGYISSYETLTVDADKTVEIPLTEEISGNQMKVVLTWDGNEDLDACLFTPYKAESGDMAHINAVNSADDYGNALALDSTNGQAAEVITIGDSTNGTYKYYVSDYNNCLNGNLTATDMLSLNVRVTVYDKNGIVATYTLPHDQSGVIWEVFEIKNGKVVTLQNTYKNLDGKSWWSEDKNVKEKLSEVYLSYKNYLEQYEETEGFEQYYYYALVYINSDEIPELVIYDDYLRAVYIAMFDNYTGNIKVVKESEGEGANDILWDACLGGGAGSPTVYYIEKENLICVENMNCFYRYDTIYTVENDKLEKIRDGWGEYEETGEFSEEYGSEYAWYWDGVSVSEEEYYEILSNTFDFSKAISFSSSYENEEVKNVVDYKNKMDMLALLENY